jgi:hypothetical protein
VVGRLERTEVRGVVAARHQEQGGEHLPLLQGRQGRTNAAVGPARALPPAGVAHDRSQLAQETSHRLRLSWSRERDRVELAGSDARHGRGANGPRVGLGRAAGSPGRPGGLGFTKGAWTTSPHSLATVAKWPR